MKNDSGIEPVGRAILVLPVERKKAGLIELPEPVKDSLDAISRKVKVVAIGPTAWDDEKVPRAKVGDTVLIMKYAGYVHKTEGGTTYRLINDRDIFAKVTSNE